VAWPRARTVPAALDPVRGMSAHFLAWPRCMNIQAEQPVAGAIGPAQRVLTRPMSLFPSVRSRPIVSWRRVGLGEHGETVN